jgi:peptidoglycan/xylan/chitin deacetylase (PgdA/CDA1 family)
MMSRSLVLASASFIALAAACSSSPTQERVGEGSAPILAPADISISGSSLPPNTVVLSYDDGPDEHTLEIAKYLASEQIHATFFVNGKRYCKVWGANGHCDQAMDTRACDNGGTQQFVANPSYYPESLIDQVQALGHRVANHSEDHCLLPEETASDAVWEVRTTQDILDRHAVDGLKLFRPPYGGWYSTATNAVATLHGDPSLSALVGPVVWTTDGHDYDCWKSFVSVEDCGQRYLSALSASGGRGIILMHDRPEWNVTYAGPLLLTQWLVPHLRALGITIAPIEQVPEIGGTTPACQPTTCNGGACGEVPDGCGGTVTCGCAEGLTCRKGSCATPCMQHCQDVLDACLGSLPASQCQTSFRQCEQRCLCKPTTCAAAGAACGSISDGCGGTLDCGGCGAGSTCSGNQCVCVPTTCNGQCGTVSDGCGGTLDCGSCGCAPSCSGKRCGAADGCGGTCYGRCGRNTVCTDDGDGLKYCGHNG